MKKIIPYLTGFLLIPGVAFAQGTLQTLLTNISIFLSDVIIPFLLGVAFVLFAFNTIRYFVINAADQESRQKARSFAMYSILAFVFIIVFWGIINLLVQTLGLDCSTVEGKTVSSDYVWKDFTGATQNPCQ